MCYICIKKMIITINTDASFNRKIQRGTYAFWIICNEYKLTMSGVLRKQVSRPEIAEFRCIINALHIVLNKKTNEKIGRIIINTDCLNVISILTDDKEKCKRWGLNSWGKDLKLKFNSICLNKIDKGIIEFRHIKSHEHTDTPRNYVNQWCDDQAKLQMMKLLNDKRTE